MNAPDSHNSELDCIQSMEETSIMKIHNARVSSGIEFLIDHGLIYHFLGSCIHPNAIEAWHAHTWETKRYVLVRHYSNAYFLTNVSI